MSKVTEFILLTLKNPSTSPSAAWADVLSSLKAVPGVAALHSGRQLEDPARAVVVVEWDSAAAFSAFASSERYTPWFASLRALAAAGSLVSYTAPLAPDPAAALGAPCTEVFVAYGVDPGFAAKTAEFAAGLTSGSAVEGFHGHAHGEVTAPLAFGADGGERGPAVTLLLGWDSKEAHLEAKGKPGPISDNIHLLRSGRKDIAMYHVNLQRV